MEENNQNLWNGEPIMQCRKCGRVIPMSSMRCCYCGKKFYKSGVTFGYIVKCVVISLLVGLFIVRPILFKALTNTPNTPNSSNNKQTNQSSASTNSTAPTKKPTSTPKPTPTQIPTTLSAYWSDCRVEYTGYEIVENMAGDRCIAIFFQFTNNSSSNKSYNTTVSCKAFGSNGIELRSSLFHVNDESKNKGLELKSKATVTVCEGFELPIGETKIEVEVDDWISFNDKNKKTFVIKIEE